MAKVHARVYVLKCCLGCSIAHYARGSADLLVYIGSLDPEA